MTQNEYVSVCLNKKDIFRMIMSMDFTIHGTPVTPYRLLANNTKYVPEIELIIFWVINTSYNIIRSRGFHGAWFENMIVDKVLDDFLLGKSLTNFRYNAKSISAGSLYKYLKKIWGAMQDAIQRGLEAEGVLPGGLGVTRKAKKLYNMRCYNEPADVAMNRIIAAYAYATSEENADEHIVVTAPTCGSCGVLPAVLYYMHHDRGFPEEEILDALAVAAIFGNVIRTNASISGAECGCQAEIGSACSMTAAALASLYGLNIDQIEYAAEIAMEHNLGLTCDPVNGLVQIPCIERNAVAAMRAISSVNLSRFLYETRKISFDEVVATMYRTGKDMDEKYRETSHGGLAKIYYGNI